MKLKFGFLAVCASLFLFCSCSRKGAWQLTWQDDFENGRMDTTVWLPRHIIARQHEPIPLFPRPAFPHRPTVGWKLGRQGQGRGSARRDGSGLGKALPETVSPKTRRTCRLGKRLFQPVFETFTKTGVICKYLSLKFGNLTKKF